MNAAIKPIPTEYSGVRFRSKSEAIFARGLDLQGFLWEYENTAIKVDDWCPDFRVVFKLGQQIVVAIIEYKPSCPTDAYLERIEAAWATMKVKAGADLLFCCYGGAYETEPTTLVLTTDDGWTVFECDHNPPHAWFFHRIDEAASYRFDLQH